MGLEKINDMRRHIGMSIDELSEKSNVPKGTLSKITAGITKNPSVDTVKSIVHAMGFTLADLDSFPNIKTKSNFSVEEIEFLNKYHDLDDHGKEMVNIVLDKESERCESEYMELVARGGKYKVKKADVVAWVKQLDLDDYEEDHDLG